MHRHRRAAARASPRHPLPEARALWLPHRSVRRIPSPGVPTPGSRNGSAKRSFGVARTRRDVPPVFLAGPHRAAVHPSCGRFTSEARSPIVALGDKRLEETPHRPRGMLWSICTRNRPSVPRGPFSSVANRADESTSACVRQDERSTQKIRRTAGFFISTISLSRNTTISYLIAFCPEIDLSLRSRWQQE